MKKILAALLFVTLISVLLLAGCGKSEESADQIGLVPQTANMIGHVQMGSIMEDGDIAAMYQALPKEEGDPQTVQEALAATLDMSGLDLKDFEDGWLFGNVSQTAGEAEYAGAILKGSFDKADLATSVESAIGEGFTTIEFQGFDVFTDSEQEAGLTILSNDLVVAGSLQAVKDVISVKAGDQPAISGELLAKYDTLDDSLVKLAVAVPEGLAEQSLQGIDIGISLDPMIAAFSAMDTVSMTMAKDGESIACNAQLFFSDTKSAESVKSIMNLVPLMMGSGQMPEGALTEEQEKVFGLLAALIGKSDSSITDSCLTISFNVTAADIEAAFPEEPDGQNTADGQLSGLAIDMAVEIGALTPGGLDTSIDVSIANHTAIAYDIGDLSLTAASKTGETYLQGSMAGTSIAANSTRTFQDTIQIPLRIAGQRDLVLIVDTTAGTGGMSMPLHASISLTTPPIESLVVMPAVDLAVDLGALTSDGLEMTLEASITNPNPFAINVGDLQTTVKGPTDNIMASGSIQGCSVAPNSTGTLSGQILMPLEVLNEPSLLIALQTQAGISGVTLPIGATMTVSMPDLGSLIAVPGIAMTVDIGDLTSDGLDLTLEASITNPNPFELELGDLQATVKGHSGNVITSSSMDGCLVGENSTGTLSGHIVMPLEVLDEPSMVITLQTQAGIAGVALPIGATMTVNMPDLGSLIAVPGIDMTVDIGDLNSDGLNMELRASISNANPFGIQVGDVQATVKGQSGNTITSSKIGGCTVGPNSTGTLTGHITMPLQALNEARIVVTVQTHAGFAGLSLPIGARITVNMLDLEALIATPGIEVYTEAAWVPRFPLPDLRLVVSSDITNNGSLDLFIGDIHASFFDSEGNLVKEMTVPGGVIEAHGSREFSGSVTLSSSQYSKLLAGDYFRVELSAEAGVSGVNATIPIAAVMTVVMSSVV